MHTSSKLDYFELDHHHPDIELIIPPFEDASSDVTSTGAGVMGCTGVAVAETPAGHTANRVSVSSFSARNKYGIASNELARPAS